MMNTLSRPWITIATLVGTLFLATEAGAEKGITAAQKVANQMKGVSDFKVRKFGELSARSWGSRIEVWRTADKKRNTVWNFTTVELGKRGFDPIAGNPRHVNTVIGSLGRGRVFHKGGVSVGETRDGVTVVMKQKRKAGRFQKKEPWLTRFSAGDTSVTYDHEKGNASATKYEPIQINARYSTMMHRVPVPYGQDFSQPATHEQLEQGVRRGPGNHTHDGRYLEFGAMLSRLLSTPSSTAGTVKYTGGPGFLTWMDGKFVVTKPLDKPIAPVAGRRFVMVNPAVSPVKVKDLPPSFRKK